MEAEEKPQEEMGTPSQDSVCNSGTSVDDPSAQTLASVHLKASKAEATVVDSSKTEGDSGIFGMKNDQNVESSTEGNKAADSNVKTLKVDLDSPVFVDSLNSQEVEEHSDNEVGEIPNPDEITEVSTINTKLYFDIQNKQWPIIYTSEYNIGFLGLEKLHPFDAGKWGRVNSFLKEDGMVRDDTIVKPLEAQQEDLLQVHSKKYLDSLKWSINVAQITEVPPVAMLPNFIVQRRVLKPFRFHVGGTVLAGKLAVERGWAINIGGGFHHCSADKGGGFCAYADITLTIKFLFNLMPEKIKKAMIIDLDAHQGNGHERDFMDDQRVYILDIYNRGIYPHDGFAKRAIRCKVELGHFTSDDTYLQLVKDNVKKAFSEFSPDVVVYNAGTDILEGDPLGLLSISPAGIIERDKIVFQEARSRDIPIVMVTSGGYQKRTARIIADSILNLKRENLIVCEEAERAPRPKSSFFKK